MNIIYEDVFANYITNAVPSEKFNYPGTCETPDLLYEPFRIVLLKGMDEYLEVNADDDVPFINESFRSHALQNAYYRRGGLTSIKGGSLLNCSMHHLCIAGDLVNLRDKNGNKFKDPNEVVDWDRLNYTTLQKIMKNHGLTHLKFEACHFQAIPTSEQDDLRHFMFERMKQWQSYNGLVADGIVGPKTIEKARERYA